MTNSQSLSDKRFYTVTDVMGLLHVKESKAYDIIKDLNTELKAKDYYVVKARVPRKYFDKRFGI
ncbi:transcriptional regulator [Metaclostridioides mangenotii]|uniref:transcriptional regulator n=1 Tax=Metaclostridioides mangenotii TaxID=1540 RepID=UPI0026EE8F98|nr:transcriptional regulator [Clostridioides mangenotii]